MVPAGPRRQSLKSLARHQTGKYKRGTSFGICLVVLIEINSNPVVDEEDWDMPDTQNFWAKFKE